MPANNDFKYYKDILRDAVSDFDSRNYARGFSALREASKIDSALATKAENLEAQYFYMLRFIASDNAMPDIDTAAQDIRIKADDIIRRIAAILSARTDTSTFSSLLRYAEMRPEESLETLFSDYLAETDRLKTDTAVLTDTRRRANLERIATDIFNIIWTSCDNDSNIELLESILSDSELPSYDRAMWTSALGLSLRGFISKPVIDLMLRLHASADKEISLTAAVWLVLALAAPAPGTNLRHNRLMADRLMPEVAKQMAEAFPDDASAVLSAWTATLETEKITNWFLNDIKPRLNDMGRRFSQKMNDSNPEDLMSDPELLTGGDSGNFDALKNFATLQNRGADVYMSTLGKLRSFPFFSAPANWFLPFHTAHSALSEVVDSEGAAIADTVASIPMMCDSDKFALILSMAATPAQMRTQAFEAMTAQLYAANDTPEFREMMEQGAIRSRTAQIADIVRNLYRVFRLYNGGKEFHDPLAAAPQINVVSAFLDKNRGLALGNQLYAQECYSDAAAYYDAFADRNDMSAMRNFARASEKAGNEAAAFAIYSDIFAKDPEDDSTALHLADLHMRRGEYEKALRLLSPFADRMTDDTRFLSKLATAYMETRQWTEAINVYHNIDYILPENDMSAKSDLAWALTLAGDTDAAGPLFEEAPESPETMQRHAVQLWLAGRRADALSLWNRSQPGPDGTTVLDSPAGKWAVGNLPGGESLHLLAEMNYYSRYGSPFGAIL